MAAAVSFSFVAEGLAASLVANINIGAQRMTVTEGGRVIATWPVSTARKGYRTPRGAYKPTRMHKMWYSRKYDMSPMPYSVFFHGGYAIHGTTEIADLGRPASHGCIRLHPDNAKILFGLVEDNGLAATLIRVVE